MTENDQKGFSLRCFKGVLSAIDYEYDRSPYFRPRLTGAEQSLYLRFQRASLRTHVIVFRWSCVMWNDYLWDWIYILVPTHRTFAILWMGGPTEPGHKHALRMWIHQLGSLENGARRGFVKKLICIRRQQKNIYIVGFKKKKQGTFSRPTLS